MLKIILAGLLCLGAQAQEWSKADTAWETACIVTEVADWMQTRQIAKHPEHRIKVVGWVDGWGIERGVYYRYEGYTEQVNPILPKRPSLAEVDRCFVAQIAAQYFAATLLKGKWRRGLQVLTVSLEVDMVQRNARGGLKLRW